MNTTESFDKVYDYGAVIIYDLAKKVGFKKFFNIASSFFFSHKDELTYADFIIFLKNKNVPEAAIEEFDKSVRK